jgi:hypothetical protein
MNIFEQISRDKTRFPVSVGRINGNLSGEDLWELNLEQLDAVARGYNKAIKETDEESFITKKSTANKELHLRFDVVKHIIDVKLEEAEKRKVAKERAVKRAELKELIGKKIRSAQEEKSLDQLQEELAILDGEQ